MAGRSDKVKVKMWVNGQEVEREVEPRRLLVDFIREDLGLTGTKVGCDTSTCGSCTIMVNGRTVKSCTMLTVMADGAEITTIEGLEKDGSLSPIQKSFMENYALQCGFCTSGMIMQSHYIVTRLKPRGEEEIRDYLHGNLCRCTGYQNIVRAIQQVGGERR